MVARRNSEWCQCQVPLSPFRVRIHVIKALQLTLRTSTAARRAHQSSANGEYRQSNSDGCVPCLDCSCDPAVRQTNNGTHSVSSAAEIGRPLKAEASHSRNTSFGRVASRPCNLCSLLSTGVESGPESAIETVLIEQRGATSAWYEDYRKRASVTDFRRP